MTSSAAGPRLHPRDTALRGDVATLPFRLLLDRSSDAFVAHDFLGRRLYSNAVYDRLVGRAAAASVGTWGPFPDWAPGTAKAVSVGMRRARDLCRSGDAHPEAIIAKLAHVSGQLIAVTMQFDVIEGPARADAIGLALVQPVDRVPWMERRTGRDISQLRALEDVIRSIALELSRVGVAPVSDLTTTATQTATISALSALSAREWKILQEILAGRRVPMIASHLNLSQHTVRNHLKSVFRKLDVHSQSELVERYRTIQGHHRPEAILAGAVASA
jgi:DNA-binding CsgD family transcriptional regulator